MVAAIMETACCLITYTVVCVMKDGKEKAVQFAWKWSAMTKLITTKVTYNILIITGAVFKDFSNGNF